MMGVSWGALAGSFLAPFMYGLYMKKVPKAAVWVNYVIGIGISVASFVCNLTGVKFNSAVLEYFKSPINAGMLAMLLGIAVTPLITLIAPAKDTDRTDKIFSCYERKVTVSSKKAISEYESSEPVNNANNVQNNKGKSKNNKNKKGNDNK